MTADPVFPATPAEFARILAATDEDRTPALHPATHDEFMRIVTQVSSSI